MGISYSPRIVTDGLVLALDAANPKSYPGSGTTWTDLSGNGNNGTLTNGVGYSSVNNGTFVFDGTDDFINCGNDSSINFGTGDFSVSAWYKRYDNATTNLRLLSKGASGDAAANGGFSIFGGNTALSFFVNPSGPRTGVNAALHSVDEWNNVVGVLERGVNQRTYQNGQPRAQTTAPVGSVNGSSILSIGDNSGTNLRWDGEISLVLLYNRALSAEEVLQNYNATKPRYNL